MTGASPLYILSGFRLSHVNEIRENDVHNLSQYRTITQNKNLADRFYTNTGAFARQLEITNLSNTGLVYHICRSFAKSLPFKKKTPLG